MKRGNPAFKVKHYRRAPKKGEVFNYSISESRKGGRNDLGFLGT